MDELKPPPLSDERPWAQGFNDWLAFGNAASAYSNKEEGFHDYERGIEAARAWFNK